MPHARRVLVIDDDPAYGPMVRRFLDKQGFAPTLAKSGHEGLDHVKEDVPDIILLDIHMKGLDGLTLYKAFRSHPTTKKVPVIIMTGEQILDSVLKAAATGVGAEPVFEKMDGLHVLLKRMKSALAAPPGGESAPRGRFLRRGLVEVDLFRREITVAGRALPKLPATRFDLFVALLRREGKAVGQDALAHEVRGDADSRKAVQMTVARLREDLKAYPAIRIETLEQSYKLVLTPRAA